MVGKMILSLVMAVIIIITGTDSNIIGIVKGIKLTEDRAKDRVVDKLVEKEDKKIEGKKQVILTAPMIQFVSKKQTQELSILSVEEQAAPAEKTNKSIKHTTADVSAYTSGYESTGKTMGDPDYGITASGKRVKENHTIACPKSLRFGTRIYVPKLRKTYTCEDRGSLITEGKLDIYIADLNKALKFGRQKLDVQIKL